MDLGLAVAISLSSSSKALGQTSVDRTLTMAAQATVCIQTTTTLLLTDQPIKMFVKT